MTDNLFVDYHSISSVVEINAYGKELNIVGGRKCDLTEKLCKLIYPISQSSCKFTEKEKKRKKKKERGKNNIFYIQYGGLVICDFCLLSIFIFGFTFVTVCICYQKPLLQCASHWWEFVHNANNTLLPLSSIKERWASFAFGWRAYRKRMMLAKEWHVTAGQDNGGFLCFPEFYQPDLPWWGQQRRYHMAWLFFKLSQTCWQVQIGTECRTIPREHQVELYVLTLELHQADTLVIWSTAQ